MPVRRRPRLARESASSRRYDMTSTNSLDRFFGLKPEVRQLDDQGAVSADLLVKVRETGAAAVNGEAGDAPGDRLQVPGQRPDIVKHPRLMPLCRRDHRQAGRLDLGDRQ